MKLNKRQKNIIVAIKKYTPSVLIGCVVVLLLVNVGFVKGQSGNNIRLMWNIQSFYSDSYTIDDVDFVWTGDLGNKSPTTETAGNSNYGQLETLHNDAKGTKEVTVYAAVDGVRVSADATCSYEGCEACPSGYYCADTGVCELGLDLSCAAYTSAADATPNLFFGPDDTVYWKAVVEGGDEPYVYEWTGAATGDTQVDGPYSVGTGEDYSYAGGPVYTATVSVSDSDARSDTASCSISIRECNTDSDCAGENSICRIEDYTCGPPVPVIIEPLFLSPAVINVGQQCAMSWEIEDAFTCDLYKNGALLEADTATTTSGYQVDPGSYLLSCENEIGESIDAGPARCLLNPEIRES